MERGLIMFRTETTKHAIAESWTAEGYRVHAVKLSGARNTWIRGDRRFNATEQNEARRAIEALCAEICEAGQ